MACELSGTDRCKQVKLVLPKSGSTYARGTTSRGLQHIYLNEALREQVFTLLENEMAPGVDKYNGRPDMDLWRILVCAVPGSWHRWFQTLRCGWSSSPAISTAWVTFCGSRIWNVNAEPTHNVQGIDRRPEKPSFLT